jgi:hypothetical protein
MPADVSGNTRNRAAGRGEIAICVCDIAAILLRVSARPGHWQLDASVPEMERILLRLNDTRRLATVTLLTASH